MAGDGRFRKKILNKKILSNLINLSFNIFADLEENLAGAQETYSSRGISRSR